MARQDRFHVRRVYRQAAKLLDVSAVQLLLGSSRSVDDKSVLLTKKFV